MCTRMAFSWPGLTMTCVYDVIRLKTSQELVSHDIHNNKFQYKHTFSLEIVPISKVYATVASSRVYEFYIFMFHVCRMM